MHYILLAIGVGLGLYGLYKFFLTANVRQVTAFLITSVFLIICVGLLFLALTGRLPAALGLLAAVWPLALTWWKMRQPKPAKSENPPPPASGPMTRREALDILGLKADAGADEIKDAHRRLIGKVHPDQQGSTWLAARINQARDVLLS